MKYLYADKRWHVSVVIPARDEEDLLPACLASIFVAQDYLGTGITTDIILVADSCTDRTIETGRELLAHRGTVVVTHAGSVGSARKFGMNVALSRNSGPLERCWLASTDADTQVPPTWLRDQVRAAVDNVEAIAGTVDVLDFAGHGPEVRDRFRATYLIGPDGTHSHVHGANLGIRADLYVKAGGWSDLATAEDHDLWRRLIRCGANVLSSSHIEVTTSGRRTGRAPLGFAGALAAHNETAA